MNFENTSKHKMLVLSLLFDVIGVITFIDIIWAPVSAYLMTKMYKGQTGKIAGTISFIEEIIPSLDIIPTFTITWFYVFVIKSKAKKAVIEV